MQQAQNGDDVYETFWWPPGIGEPTTADAVNVFGCLEPPNYYADLTAVQTAWGCLGWEEKNEVVTTLKSLVEEAFCEAYFAIAAQRAEAFGLTLGLWK